MFKARGCESPVLLKGMVNNEYRCMVNGIVVDRRVLPMTMFRRNRKVSAVPSLDR